MLSLIFMSVGVVFALICTVLQFLICFKSKKIDWVGIGLSILIVIFYFVQFINLFSFNGKIIEKESVFIPVVSYVYDSPSGNHVLQSGYNYYLTIKKNGKEYAIAVDEDVYNKYAIGDYYGE